MSQPSSPAKEMPVSFILPDLVGHCKFKLSYHPQGDPVAAECVKWMDTNCPDLNEKQKRALYGLQAGELTAYCYHYSTPERLRVVSDFMTYLFHLDNISDGMMTRETDVLANVVMNALWHPERYNPTKDQAAEELNPGKLARDFWARCIPDCGPGAQGRFKETMTLFFECVQIQARARDEGVTPDLESYIDIRRDTSGCRPCWALIEYALDIDLPDFVVEDPVINALNQGTNDLVSWSNDLFSYNVEQSRGDTHNMIAILMEHHGHTLQSAVDYVGDLCQQSIDTFCENKTKIPSWGPELDDQVARYVQGLQEWIVGSLHWSFQTTRYFGTTGHEVKQTRVVKLLPLRQDSISPPPPPVPSSSPEPLSDRKDYEKGDAVDEESSILKPTILQLRSVASSVSGRPGSQTLEHAATNVKEELGNSATDLAKVIAGANMTSDSVVDHSGDSFIGITSKLASQVPEPILVLGLAGGIPYLGASATTVYLARQAEMAASGVAVGIDPGVASTILDQALNFQVTYGAVMLSFLGALHWGFEMAGYGGHKGYTRLLLGTAPMVVAWTTLGMQPMEALCAQWLGYTGLWYCDAKATMAGWAPKWYSQYRFYLSILVGTCIIGSLAGTSFFGPVAGHGFITHDLDHIREERRANMPLKHGLVKGPIEAVPADVSEDRFTRIHKRA